MIVVLWPPAPRMPKALVGSGQPPLPFTHMNAPPYWGLPSVTQVGASVRAYSTYPSGKMRSPFHMPSCRYRFASRAQSRAGKYS